MRYLLVGNYGVGNLGDEALKEYFLTKFTHVDWFILSADSSGMKEFPRLPAGFRSLFSGEWLKTWKALKVVDGVVFGGGSLFTDTESVHACFIWWVHAFCAKLRGKPIFLAFQGIGPFKTKLGELLSRSVVQSASFVSVRDETSFLRVESWCKKCKCIQTFDPVYSLMESKKFPEGDTPIFVVIPRTNSGKGFLEITQKLLKAHPEFKEVHILSMQPEDESEKELCQTIRADCGLPSFIFEIRTVDELMMHVYLGSFVLAQRFHGALAALAAGKQVHICPQGKEDKLWALRKLVVDEENGIAISGLQERVERGEDALKLAFQS